MEERKKALTHQELQKALVEKCDFDVPETLMDQVPRGLPPPLSLPLRTPHTRHRAHKRHTASSRHIFAHMIAVPLQVAKERFAMMLADMREKGATDDDLKVGQLA
eukprot:1662624-Prymnesium_polylepis.1